MRFGKYLNNISSDDAHTNADNISPGSQQSYTQRQELDQRRRHIGSYAKSRLGNGVLSDARRVYAAMRTVDKDVSGQNNDLDAPGNRRISSIRRGATSGRQVANAKPQVQRPAFKEPPSRGYNPYQ